jgi:hypothetical protein
MRKRTYAAAAVLSAAAAALVAATQAPEPALPQTPAEKTAARKKAFAEARYQPYTAFVDFAGVVSTPDPRGIDLAITVKWWVGPQFKAKLGGEGKGFLLVEAYDPVLGTKGEPVTSSRSKVFPFVPGIRGERTFNVQLPLPPNPQPYPVTVTVLSTVPERFIGPDGDVQEKPWVHAQRKTTVTVLPAPKTKTGR